MKKDKEWLSEQVRELNSTDAVFNESGVSYIDTAVSIERVYDLIEQLDELEEITEGQAYDKIAETFPATVKEIDLVLGKYYSGMLVEFYEKMSESVMRALDVEATSKTIEALTGMTLEQIAEEARNGGIVPKQEEVDRAYKDGYETGKQHATEKQSKETETFARVLADYLIASAKLKLVLSMEVEEAQKMKDKEFMKIVCEVKGIYPDGLTAMVDYGGIHLILNKEEVIELASRLEEVEKEPLFYVMKDGVVILSKRYRDYDSRESHWIGTVTNKEYIKENPDKVRFTEQEIKDYDERFWSFAVPVEEVSND